jgi:hypothetical protein
MRNSFECIKQGEEGTRHFVKGMNHAVGEMRNPVEGMRHADKR